MSSEARTPRKLYPFDPDWCIAPGSTLQEWREDNQLPVKAAAKACGRMDPKMFTRIETGMERITEKLARQLEAGTQIPARLWLNMERYYRKALAAGKKDWT